jgi:hypothetical protein
MILVPLLILPPDRINKQKFGRVALNQFLQPRSLGQANRKHHRAPGKNISAGDPAPHQLEKRSHQEARRQDSQQRKARTQTVTLKRPKPDRVRPAASCRMARSQE